MNPSTIHASIKNDRVLRAIRREPVDVTPIWIMRQAGRYLPEYRVTREKAGSFMTLCKTPALACEVTLQPLDRYDLDAAIIFSDILTIPDAMGLGLSFIEGEGPRFANPIRSAADVAKLAVPDREQLDYVYEAIRLTKTALAGRVPLIGFCGSPFTLAAYMIDGQSKTTFAKTLDMAAKEPLLLHNLLDVLAKSVCAHLQAQIEAGADVVMIFDTWGGLLTTAQYDIFSLTYIKSIIFALQQSYNYKKIPLILFTKGGSCWLEQMAEAGVDMIGVDWKMSLHDARRLVGNKVALQGNMNPTVLLSSADVIEREAAQILKDYGEGSGHVFNLGHGITPDVSPEHVKVLVDAVHELSKPYHKVQYENKAVS